MIADAYRVSGHLAGQLQSATGRQQQFASSDSGLTLFQFWPSGHLQQQLP